MSDDAIETPAVDEESPALDIKAVIEEAQENFSLADRLRGAKKTLPTGKVPIFLDVEAMTAYHELKERTDLLQALVDSLDEVKDLEEYDAQTYQRNATELDGLLVDLEAAKIKMLENTISVHLRAYPDIAVKVAQREARKIFMDPDTRMLRDEFDGDDSADWMEKRLLSESIVKVLDHHGNEVDFGVPKTELGALFGATLHAAQWQNLLNKYNEVCLLSGIVRGVLDDPGF